MFQLNLDTINNVIELLGDFNYRVRELNKKILFANQKLSLENKNLKVFFKRVLAVQSNDLDAIFDAEKKAALVEMANSSLPEPISIDNDPDYVKYTDSSGEMVDMITALQNIIISQTE